MVRINANIREDQYEHIESESKRLSDERMGRGDVSKSEVLRMIIDYAWREVEATDLLGKEEGK